MITVLTGDNNFETTRALEYIVATFDGAPEQFNGGDIEVRQLPDILMATTLFADKRLVVIKNLSENKVVWSVFDDWLARVSDDIHVVLVEAKLDKRTKTYKALQKIGDMREFQAWTERDMNKAEQWAIHEAKSNDFELDKRSAHTLVARVGADQWLLYQALLKLSVMDDVSPKVVEELIEAHPSENVFDLFEAALKSDTQKVGQMIQALEVSEDPYRLFGLLSGQAFQLAALAASDKPSAEIAKELGAHPFAVGKLAAHAHRLQRSGAKKVISALAEADAGMKTSVAEPWLLIERALIKITRI